MKSIAPITTVQQHILQEQKRFPGASGEFSWLLSGITLATKLIQARVRRAGLGDDLGAHGEINVQGEMQQVATRRFSSRPVGRSAWRMQEKVP